VGQVPEVHQRLIKALHSSPLGGGTHSGMAVTCRRLKQIFYWNDMKKDVL
jgi:hypothetical protein